MSSVITSYSRQFDRFLVHGAIFDLLVMYNVLQTPSGVRTRELLYNM